MPSTFPPPPLDIQTLIVKNFIPPPFHHRYKTMESSKKKNAQLEYRALLDAQVARKNVPAESPVRKLLKARRAAEDDVEVVPTMLKDRPW